MKDNEAGIIGIHHIGYFVKNINRSKEFFEFVGFTMEKPYYDDKRKVNLCFGVMGDNLIELVESASNESTVAKMKDRGGTRPYHICYEVDNIDTSVRFLKSRKCIVLNDIIVSTIEDRKVVHMYHKDMGVFELIERK